MNGVLGHDAVLSGYIEPGATEGDFYMNYAPGAGLIARPVDLQSMALPLSTDS